MHPCYKRFIVYTFVLLLSKQQQQKYNNYSNTKKCNNNNNNTATSEYNEKKRPTSVNFFVLKNWAQISCYPGGVRILQIWLVNPVNSLERIETILLVKNTQPGEVCQLEFDYFYFKDVQKVWWVVGGGRW